MAKKLLCYYCLGMKNPLEEERGLKNFDQWTEELLKDAFLQASEDGTKVPLKADEALADDDFEEE